MPNSGTDLASTVAYAGQDASMINGFLEGLQSISEANTARSEELAEQAWQRELEAQQRVMDFNALEAAKNRDWQQMMSSTAHQREVQDLIAAGLNPVLSATGGNGAAVTSGAAASSGNINSPKGDVDTSANSAIVSVLASALNRQTQLEAMNISARNNEKVAEMYTEATKAAAMISGNYSLAAMQQSGANMLSAQAQQFGFNTDLLENSFVKEILKENNKYKNEIKLMNEQGKIDKSVKDYINTNNPSNLYQAFATLIKGMTGQSDLTGLFDATNYTGTYVDPDTGDTYHVKNGKTESVTHATSKYERSNLNKNRNNWYDRL